MSGWSRCAEVHGDGKRCLLVEHPSNVPHCTVGPKGWRFWGGRCENCWLPAERSHERCADPKFRVEEGK